MSKREKLRNQIAAQSTSLLLETLAKLGHVAQAEAAEILLHAMIATELEERLNITDDEFDAVFTDDYEGTYAEALLTILASRNDPAVA